MARSFVPLVMLLFPIAMEPSFGAPAPDTPVIGFHVVPLNTSRCHGLGVVKLKRELRNAITVCALKVPLGRSHSMKLGWFTVVNAEAVECGGLAQSPAWRSIAL